MPRKFSGPKPKWIWGNLLEFGRDPLNFLESSVEKYGDFVQFRFLNHYGFILANPADIETVLVTQSRNFRKTLGYRTPFMRRLFGQGLLTSENDTWTKQRRLAQPAFHRDRIMRYAEIIVGYATELAASWKDGVEREIHQEIMFLTTRVVVRCLFNSDVPREIRELGQASNVVMKRFNEQWTPWRIFLMLLPRFTESKFEAVMGALDKYIYGLIEERRSCGEDQGDLLSMLVAAQDENGALMTDRQLRDELTTLMVAGLDTTALAVSWALYLLALHPPADELLQEELNNVLGGRAPGFNDLRQLVYTEKIIKETMRLYPPAWVIGRESINPVELQGAIIPKGTPFLCSQWLMHRDERFFPNATEFRPERWCENMDLPRFAYFPFGGGPRVCIGNNFAMMEATLVLATLAQKWRWTCPADYRVKPWPSITLQPEGGIQLTPLARA